MAPALANVSLQLTRVLRTLASRLLESLDAPDLDEVPGAVAAAWETELDRRDAEFDADPALGVPAEDAFARLEADLLAQRRSHESHR